MKVIAWSAVFVTALGVGFFLLPSSEVEAKKVTSVQYPTVELYRSLRAGYWQSPTDPKRVDPVIRRVDKSGLEMAIEGRLKWLGFDTSPAEFCYPDADGIICEYT